MAKTRPPYPAEFRQEAVRVLRSGVPLARLAGELGVSQRRCGTGAPRTWGRPSADHPTRSTHNS